MPLLESAVQVQVRNILFTTDFSPASLSALPFAVGLAERYGAHIYAAHVVLPEMYPLVPPDAIAAPTGYARKHAMEAMERLMCSGRMHGVPTEPVLVEGDVASALEDVVTRYAIDMVVIATHGRRGVQKLLLGSVAERIFRNAPCPVLTVGPRVKVTTNLKVDVSEVIYPTDFTDESITAVPYACSVAREYKARLTLLHVVEGFGAMSREDRERIERPVISKLNGLIPYDADLWCRPDCLVEFGTPEENILGVAESRHADLILMGVKKADAGAGHFLLGTAYKVASRAHCPVLTVRG